MKKLTTMFLSMLMVITVTACGGVSEDVDQYIAYSVSMMGINLEPREVSDEEILLALDEKGKAEFTLEGTSYNCKWEMDGEEFTLYQGKDEFSGTMIDDLITIENILDSGMDIIFLKEGAEPPVDTSKPIGKYLLSGMDLYGMKMSYADIQDAGMEMDLEFQEDDTAVMSSNGDVLELSIDYDGNIIEIDGMPGDFIFEDEQFTIIAEEEGAEMIMIFTAEDSEKWVDIKAEGSTLEDAFEEDSLSEEDVSSVTIFDDTESSTALSNAFVAPGYGAEATVPVEKLSVPSEWYGMINISDYQGPYGDNMYGEHEAWGTLSHDDTGCYFQIYVDGIYSDSSVILSYYADVYEYTFYPIVHASSWLFDINITEDDEMLYTPTLTNGVLSASYDYVDDDESFTFTYELAMIEGTGLGN